MGAKMYHDGGRICTIMKCRFANALRCLHFCASQGRKRNTISMAFKRLFVLSSEAVNSYGFVVKTAGIRLDNARNNCPAFMITKHAVSLGQNLRVENASCLAILLSMVTMTAKPVYQQD